jgi:hypothetical protein
MNDLRQHFAQFITELRQSGVATELRGCTPAEVADLEATLEQTLPLAYKLYLESMGHSAGRLFTHDHLAVTYNYVLQLGQQLKEAMSEEQSPGTILFRLPEQGVVIASRLAGQFHYILCDRPDDAAVFYVNTWEQKALQVYPSILAWLRSHEASALDAIRSGYFDDYPNGTTP